MHHLLATNTTDAQPALLPAWHANCVYRAAQPTQEPLPATAGQSAASRAPMHCRGAAQSQAAASNHCAAPLDSVASAHCRHTGALPMQAALRTAEAHCPGKQRCKASLSPTLAALSKRRQ